MSVQGCSRILQDPTSHVDPSNTQQAQKTPSPSTSAIPPEDGNLANNILDTQADQPTSLTENPVISVKKGQDALIEAAQILNAQTGVEAPTGTAAPEASKTPKVLGAELIEQLEKEIAKNPALKDDAHAFGMTIKILLNTCLTGTPEEKAAAQFQLLQQLPELAREGVDPTLLNSINQLAQDFRNVKVSTEMTESELVNMVQTVMENSEKANSGVEFADRVHEQIVGSHNAPSDEEKEVYKQGLAESLAALEAQYVSHSMLKALENVDVPTPPVDTPPTNAIAPDLFAKVEGNVERTAALTTLLGKFGNAETAITVLRATPDAKLFELLDATHNLATGGNEAHVAFANKLDDAFMPHLAMHGDVTKVKQESIAHLDAATQKQIISSHQKHLAASIIADALPVNHPLKAKAVSDITHADILDLIEHNADFKLPDIALCNTYFLLGEGAVDASGNALTTKDLAKALPPAWRGVALYQDLATRGVGSTKKLNEGMAILNGTIMSRSAKDAMISLIASSRSDAQAKSAEDNVRRLATHILGIDSGVSIDTPSLLALCAKKFDVKLPQDTGIIGAYGVLTQKAGQRAYMARLDTTFEAMTAKQKLEKEPAETKGETLAYSVLTMQRALVRDVKELSALDLSTLGATPDDIKDPESLKYFVENVWQDKQQNDWASAILLKSYLDAGGNDPRFTHVHPALKDNAQVFAAPNPADFASLELLAKGGLTSMVAQLDKGRTASSSLLNREHSDPAGRHLKALGRRYCDPTTSVKDKETLRKEIIALINGTSVTIDGEEHSYLCPVDCAHAAMLNKHQTELRGVHRVQNMQEKATGQKEQTAMAKQIQRDFVQLAGLADRKAVATGNLLTEFMAALNDNPNFTKRAKPLALLDAQRQCGLAHVSDLFTQEHQVEAKAAIAKSFQTMGIGAKESELAAAGIMAEHSKPNAVLQAFDAMGERVLTAYTLCSDAQRLAAAPTAVKSFIEIDRIEQNTLKVLEDLPVDTAFSMDRTVAAKATVGASAGAVSLSAEIKLGEQDGMTLWHDGPDANGREKYGISISRGYLAELKGSASAAELLKLEASVSGDASKGIVLEFDTKDACAQFASRFLSNTAKREDISLASRVHIGESYSIGGSVSAEIGVEHEVGVCTVALGASASVSGKVQYSRSVSGNDVTTTSTSTITHEVSASASVSTEVEPISTSLETSYEDTTTQTSTVTTSLTGALLSAKSITAVSIQSGDNIGLKQFCARHGAPSEMAAQIQTYMTENALDSVMLEAHYVLNDQGRSAGINGESTNTIINNPSNYKIASLDVVSSEDGDSRGFDFGFLQNQTLSGQTTRQSFAIA